LLDEGRPAARLRLEQGSSRFRVGEAVSRLESVGGEKIAFHYPWPAARWNDLSDGWIAAIRRTVANDLMQNRPPPDGSSPAIRSSTSDGARRKLAWPLGVVVSPTAPRSGSRGLGPSTAAYARPAKEAVMPDYSGYQPVSLAAMPAMSGWLLGLRTS